MNLVIKLFRTFCIVSLLYSQISISFSSFFRVHTDNTKAYGMYIPNPTPQLIKEHGTQYLHSACFLTPQVLEKAREEACPFILIIPEQLDGYTPISQAAPIIEAARIALTWTSAYHRFPTLGNVDVKVVLISQTNNNLKHLEQAIRKIMEYDIHDKQNCTPEMKMKKRIIKERQLPATLSKNELEISTYYTVIAPKTPILIKPNLSSYPTKKRVVLTGAAGFIGSHLTRELLSKDYQVIALDNLSCCTGENLDPFQYNNNISFHRLDVSNPFDIEGNVYIVIHCASVPSPAQYYAKPVETLRSGLHGTQETLELARRKNARFVFASSSEVYGNPKIHPQPEEYPGNVNPIGKRSQYDESKRGAETLIKHYFETYQLDVRIARIFNTFGPGMQLSDGRVITNFIHAALTNSPMIIHGDGNQTRSPAYVSDTVDGLIKITESDEIGNFISIDQRIYNVGSEEELSINAIASMSNQIAEKLLGTVVPIHHITNIDTTDPNRRKPDLTRLKTIAQFEPNITFCHGFEQTFLYYYNKQQSTLKSE